MDTFPSTGRSVWGSEELGFSPTARESPVGSSFMDSGESSEDWEDYTSSLAEEVAQSMLVDDEDDSTKETIAAPKSACSGSQGSPTSPQSTLAALGGYNWEGWNPDGSSSGFSSPPTPVAAVSSKADGGVVDGLYAELLRLKLEGEMKSSGCRRQLLSRQEQIIKRPTPPLGMDNVYSRGRRSIRTATSDDGSQQVVSGSKQVGVWVGSGGAAAFRPGHYNKRSGSGSDGTHGVVGRHDRVMRTGYEGWDAVPRKGHQHFSLFANDRSNEGGRSGGHPATVMPRGGGGSGMRAVFLDSRDSSCGGGGTGVFLPRRLGSLPDSKRKPACSTVLLPSRVVHALNLNVEDTLTSPLRRDETSRSRTNAKFESKEEKASFPSPHAITFQEIAPDIRLPSEWMY